MFSIREAIVVEGRYDKIALENIVDTEIFTTDGFGIFRDEEKISLLRRIAEKRGLIVLTDSDGAGLVIRNRLRGAIDPKFLKHAYIPDIPGKERRKKTFSKAGTLGVEGMTPKVLEEIIVRAGADISGSRKAMTKADLYSLGLTGHLDSAAKRRVLQRKLALPDNISSSALLDVINSLYSTEEVLTACSECFLQEK